jgi:hypothetical protein
VAEQAPGALLHAHGARQVKHNGVALPGELTASCVCSMLSNSHLIVPLAAVRRSRLAA